MLNTHINTQLWFLEALQYRIEGDQSPQSSHPDKSAYESLKKNQNKTQTPKPHPTKKATSILSNFILCPY